MWIWWHASSELYYKALERVVVAVLVLFLATGCAGPHFDITREIGLFPPQIENRSDFYEDADKRCKQYDRKYYREQYATNMTNTDPAYSVACIRFWEALLWAQDYKSYAEARATLNRNFLYLGGVLALVSAGALVGLAAFGSTSSDAYKIIPIAGTFVGGLLGFSKNDALYEAYQGAATKIDQVIRRAEDKVGVLTLGSYEDASALLRREVGNAIDELNQTKLDIIKFQAKSEAEQFKQVQQGTNEKDLATFSLKAVKAEPIQNPKKIIASLSSSPDPQKLSAGELRLKLTDSQNNSIQILRASSLNGADIEADIPTDLQDHGIKTYLTEIQARNGTYTLRDAQRVKMDYSKVRFDVAVKGNGKVTYSYPDPDSTGKTKTVECQMNKACDTTKLPIGLPVKLKAITTPSETQVVWKNVPSCAVQTPAPFTCDVNPTTDLEVSVEFK